MHEFNSVYSMTDLIVLSIGAHVHTNTHSQEQCRQSSNKTDDVLSFECADYCYYY